MKNLYKQKRTEGFTIIEVMIVLAIAAVILLIVLLAVPALQRNSRNTQRANDAGTIAAAVNTCLADHNGSTASCQVVNATTGVDVDLTKLGQFTAVTYAAGGQGNLVTANWMFQYKCNANGTPAGGASAKAVAVTWQNESSGGNINRCVEG